MSNGIPEVSESTRFSTLSIMSMSYLGSVLTLHPKKKALHIFAIYPRNLEDMFLSSGTMQIVSHLPSSTLAIFPTLYSYPHSYKHTSLPHTSTRTQTAQRATPPLLA